MAEGEAPESDDRTEAPSERRLQRAREEGDAPVSREVVALASLGGGMLGLAMIGPTMGKELLHLTRALLERSHELQVGAAAPEALRLLLMAGLPAAALAATGGVLATLLQNGFLVSGKGLVPQFGRLNPLTGLKRMFGPQGLFELLRAALKLVAASLGLWWALGSPEQAARTLGLSPGVLLEESAALLLRLMAGVLGALAAIALLDVAWTRWRHTQRLRMSRQDLRDEAKESDGDPQIKARQRQIRLQRARRRIAQEVPKAQVVVTNPTHYAVALAYARGQDAAPRVVARGADAMAAQIRKLAREHGVPLVANPPLARALYRVEEGTEVPAEHYHAVAQVIAYVWRLRGGARAGGAGSA
jgi:flagellar biosynthetic protein FlhB